MKTPLTLTINGETVEALVEPRTTLLTFLREQCGLTGPKRGCEEGECGCCAVLLDGELVDSCLILALEAQGHAVSTVEALAGPTTGGQPALSPLQQAFVEAGAAQCGFCTPGMLMAATTLLEQDSTPDELTVRRALSGNLCRCTGYDRIVRAVQLAAELRHGGTQQGRTP
jgi:carbon-monoxide dehydrogenase small subunit